MATPPPSFPPRSVAGSQATLRHRRASPRAVAGGTWDSLSNAVLQRLRGPANSGTNANTRSALNKLEEFAEGPARDRPLFIQPSFYGDLHASSYNEWSLLTFAEWLTVVNSRKTGKPVMPATIECYMSLIKTELGIHFGCEPVINGGKRIRRVLKSISTESPAHDRKKRRGLRGRHLAKAFKKMHYGTSRSVQSVNEWASVATAREALARGGEVTKASRGGAGPTRADLSFEHDKYGRTATLWLRPLKKRGKAAAAKVPIVFAEYDGGGADTYSALRRLVEVDRVPLAARSSTPLFRNADGSALSQSSFRNLVKKIATALGYDPAGFGGHSPRIGGATDIGDKNPLMLQAKGRWGSDIAKIYNRLTRRGLVAASLAMHRKGSRDMEELYAGFAQPA